MYVNDNFGRWQSDFRGVVEHCLHDGVLGEPLAKLLALEEKDSFVLNTKYSAFFSTTLDVLLEYLQAKTLILTGLAGNICVLFTANDAYMRDCNLIVPEDCIASNTPEENAHKRFLEAVLEVKKKCRVERSRDIFLGCFMSVTPRFLHCAALILRCAPVEMTHCSIFQTTSQVSSEKMA